MRREMQVSVCSVIMTGYNILMPEKLVKIHRNDPPWISEELKHLITLRQRAFSSGNNVMFKFYLNKVNRTKKSCRGKYFAYKFIKLKQTNQKTWGSEVKSLSGMTSAPNELLNQLHIDNTQDLSSKDFADLINNSLIAPMRAYNPLDTSNISTLLDEIHEYPNLNTNLADTDLLCVKEVKKPQPVQSTRPSWH